MQRSYNSKQIIHINIFAYFWGKFVCVCVFMCCHRQILNGTLLAIDFICIWIHCRIFDYLSSSLAGKLGIVECSIISSGCWLLGSDDRNSASTSIYHEGKKKEEKKHSKSTWYILIIRNTANNNDKWCLETLQIIMSPEKGFNKSRKTLKNQKKNYVKRKVASNGKKDE